MKHKHHIIPKHMGGTDDPDNLVDLTIEEHAKAHLELYETYGKWQDKVAYAGLAKLVGKEEHLYMVLSEGKIGVPRSKETKEKIRKARSLNRYQNTEEHNRKISEAQKGKPKSEETKQKMREARLGKTREPFSQEWKNNLKAAKEKLPVVSCPHCGLTSRGPNMKRYHFDNCKLKRSE
jgi:hypothetical protein